MGELRRGSKAEAKLPLHTVAPSTPLPPNLDNYAVVCPTHYTSQDDGLEGQNSATAAAAAQRQDGALMLP